MKKSIKTGLFLLCAKTLVFGQNMAQNVAQNTAQNTQVNAPKTAVSKAVEPVAWNTLEHDFGNIPQGQGVSFDFKFTNNTADSIEIDNIRTTCGCTAATWQENAIQPAQTTTIPVLFDALETGYFEKKIKVYLRHVKKPFILTITGEVK